MSKLRHAYSPSQGGVTTFQGKSKTKQSFKDECDVNNIVKRHYSPGGEFDVVKFSEAIVELPDNLNYHEALNQVIAADQAFLELPSEIRSVHENDPGKFLAFMESEPYLSRQVDLLGREIVQETASETVESKPESAAE